MPKILVKPSKVKAFLITPEGFEIQAFRPTLTVRSSFISNVVAQEKLKLATDSDILDSAEDKDFEEIFFSNEILKASDGDDVKREKLAISAFLKKFSAASAEEKADAEKAAAEKAAEEKAAADKAAADKAAADKANKGK